jgi:hypothetical protein
LAGVEEDLVAGKREHHLILWKNENGVVEADEAEAVVGGVPALTSRRVEFLEKGVGALRSNGDAVRRG